jgi:signal peptidase I
VVKTTLRARFAALSRARRIVLVVGLFLLVDLATFSLVGLLAFDRYRPGTTAMEPILRPGQHIWARPTGTARRGDVVLLKTTPPANDFFPNRGPILVISRVVAVAGDTIESVDGKLVVNGAVVDEPYLAAGTQTRGVNKTTIPAGRLFYMGDNRTNSADSRVVGPVPVSAIRARVQWIGAPSLGFVIAGTLLFAFCYLVATERSIRALISTS